MNGRPAERRFARTYQRFVALAAVGVATGIASRVPAATFTWDAGGGTDTSINNALNWGANVNPSFTSSDQATFSVANGTATINTSVAFGPVATPSVVPAVQFASNFTLGGTSDLVLYGSNSGSTVVLRSNSGASLATVNAPLKVFSTSPAAAPLGNLLSINVNNTTANSSVTAVALNITNGIALASGSTASTYDIRYANGSGGFANGRIAGTISGLGTLSNASTPWAGSLLIAGNQASTSTSNISILSGTGYGNPTTSARLVLGEAVGDTQTWNAIALNHTMNLAIGGTITASSLSSTVTTAKVTGIGNTGAVLTLSSGTIGSTLAMGGTGTGENVFGLTKQGSGTLSIDGAKTYTGATTINGGTLSIASTGSLTSNITLNVGATLAGEGSTSGTLAFGTGTSTLNFDVSTASAAFTAASASASSGAMVVVTPSATVTSGTYNVINTTGGFGSTPLSTFALATRGGSLAYSGNNLVYNAAPVTAASLVWKGNSGTNPTYWDTVNTVNWTNGGSPDRFYAGDSVTFDDTASSFAVAVQGASQSAGDIVFNNAVNAYTVTGAIVGSGSLTKTGAASVTLSGAVTRSGAISVSDGLLTLSSTTNTITGTGGISVSNSGELRFAANPSATLGNQNVTLDGGAITYTGGATTTNDVQNFSIAGNGSTIRVSSSPNIVWRIGGAITGSGNWTKSGTSVLALGRNADTGPANTFTGTVTVAAGVLDIRHSDSLGSTAAGTTVQNAMLLVQNFGQTGGTRQYAEPLTFTGTSFLGNLNQQTPVYVTQMTGPISVSGTLGVSTAITGGATPTTLELIGSTIATATGSSIVLGRQGAYPNVLISANQTINVGSSITGAGSLVTDANATAGSKYTLTGNNSYTGTTTVNGGTLLVNGTYTGGGAFTVNSGTLGGTGSITGDVTLAATGAKLAPGASIESLDITGNVDLTTGTLEIEFNGAASTPIDLIAISGSLDIDSATLNFTSLGASLDPQQTYVFATYGSLVGSAFPSVTNLPSTHVLSYTLGGNSIALVPIPEPTTLVGAGVLAGMVLRRRRLSL